MLDRHLLIACAAALAACGDARPRGPSLQITGESTKLREGDPLPATSPFFDGAKVSLRGARGEVLGLIVWRAAAAEVEVALAIDGVDVAGYRVVHHDVRRGSTAMYGPTAGRGRWPDRLDPVAAAVPTTRAAFFEVTIPADAAGGARAGTLRVGDATFPVELAVDDVALPEAAPWIWAYVDAKEIERAGRDPVDWARGLRRFGVVASPDLPLEAWPRWREVLAGLPLVPALLPDDADAEAAAVRGWIATLDGTGQRAFAIPIDEPGTPEEKQAVRARAARVRAAAGGPGRFLYAVTDTHHDVYEDLIDVYISPYAGTLERPAWTYNGGEPFAGPLVLDAPGVSMRTWGWIAWRWRVPLWYVWDAAYWSDRHNHRRRTGVRGLAPPSSLDDDPITFDDGDDRGNLDGVLAYPHAPSLRLAALRRGVQDRALLEGVAACAGRDAADAIARELVPSALGDAGRPGDRRRGSWPVDEARWEAARRALLDQLGGCQGQAPVKQ